MSKTPAPPVDEDDPVTSASEVTPEKIDLQKKTPGDTPPKSQPEQPARSNRKH